MTLTRSVHVCGQMRVTMRTQSCHERDRFLCRVVPPCVHATHRSRARWWESDAQSRPGLLAVTARVVRPDPALQWRCCSCWWAARTARGPCPWPPPRRSAGALRGGMICHSSLAGMNGQNSNDFASDSCPTRMRQNLPYLAVLPRQSGVRQHGVPEHWAERAFVPQDKGHARLRWYLCVAAKQGVGQEQTPSCNRGTRPLGQCPRHLLLSCRCIRDHAVTRQLNGSTVVADTVPHLFPPRPRSRRPAARRVDDQ
jgi:hypothetical protein